MPGGIGYPPGPSERFHAWSSRSCIPPFTGIPFTGFLPHVGIGGRPTTRARHCHPPADPDVKNYLIRLLEAWVRCAHVAHPLAQNLLPAPLSAGCSLRCSQDPELLSSFPPAGPCSRDQGRQLLPAPPPFPVPPPGRSGVSFPGFTGTMGSSDSLCPPPLAFIAWAAGLSSALVVRSRARSSATASDLV